MKKWRGLALFVGAFVALVALAVVMLMPRTDSPASYADRYGGDEQSYRNIANMTDCQLLGQRAADMGERYHRPSESAESKQMALGFQTAYVDRMVELDCP